VEEGKARGRGGPQKKSREQERNATRERTFGKKGGGVVSGGKGREGRNRVLGAVKKKNKGRTGKKGRRRRRGSVPRIGGRKGLNTGEEEKRAKNTKKNRGCEGSWGRTESTKDNKKFPKLTRENGHRGGEFKGSRLGEKGGRTKKKRPGFLKRGKKNPGEKEGECREGGFQHKGGEKEGVGGCKGGGKVMLFDYGRKKKG